MVCVVLRIRIILGYYKMIKSEHKVRLAFLSKLFMIKLEIITHQTMIAAHLLAN